MSSLKAKDFDRLHAAFSASISTAYDCGQYCAPLNGGVPVCCDTGHAVPVVEKAEWKALKGRTDLWHKYKPAKDDESGQKIVDELAESCTAIECKGARFCERDNRTIACRAFPFYPYTTNKGEILGLAYYWDFEDRCWVLSNLEIVEPEFVRQILATYREIFERDDAEFDAFKEQATKQRRVFSRRGRAIPLILPDGSLAKVLPKGGGVVPAKIADFEQFGPYKSAAAYKRACAEAAAQYDTEGEDA